MVNIAWKLRNILTYVICLQFRITLKIDIAQLFSIPNRYPQHIEDSAFNPLNSSCMITSNEYKYVLGSEIFTYLICV